jgi:hypothetical protein
MFDLSKIRKPQYSCESHHGGFGTGPLWLVYARIFPTGQLFTRNLFKHLAPAIQRHCGRIQLALVSRSGTQSCTRPS